MATRRKKIVIAATSMLILLTMVGYSNADAAEDRTLAEKYCGGATAMIVTEIGIEGKEDNEDFRCWAKTDIKKPDLMSEEEFCSYVMPLAFDKYKDGKCYFIPFVNCDSSTTFAYYSLCVRILESKDNFVNQEAQCKLWGGELLKVPARNLRKWVYRNHKGSFWTSLEEEENESLVLYTFDNIADPDIHPGSLVKTPKKEKNRRTVIETDKQSGQTFSRLVLEGNLHGGICTKPGALTIAGRKDKLELYSAIHPNSYGTPTGAKIFVSTGVYVPRIGSTKNKVTDNYGQFDYSFYQDICALVPDVGKLQSQVGIPHNDLKESLEKVVREGKWGMLGTTGIRESYTVSCDKSREWKDGFGFQSIYGKQPYKIDDKLSVSNNGKIKECSDMPDTTLVVTENGLLPRAPFVRTHLFCYVGEPLAFKGLARAERCDDNASYNANKDECKCNMGYQDRGQRGTGTECDICPMAKLAKPASIFLTFDQKNLKKEILSDVIKSTSTLNQKTLFSFYLVNNARNHALGGEVGGWNMHKHFMDNADYVQNIYAQWSFILTFYGLGNTIYNAAFTPILMIITDGKVEEWTKNEVFGETVSGNKALPVSFLLEFREKRDDAKFLFVNVVDKNSDVAKMKKDWIAAGIARSEEEIVAVKDPKSMGDSLVFHLIQFFCKK